jgi:hypothetical protein
MNTSFKPDTTISLVHDMRSFRIVIAKHFDLVSLLVLTFKELNMSLNSITREMSISGTGQEVPCFGCLQPVGADGRPQLANAKFCTICAANMAR